MDNRKYFTLKGESEPYPDGSKVITYKEEKGVILHECYCTADKYIHYEVQLENKDYIVVLQHPDLKLDQ